MVITPLSMGERMGEGPPSHAIEIAITPYNERINKNVKNNYIISCKVPSK
jgi:hypothetical protein